MLNQEAVWINESEILSEKDGVLKILAPAQSDLFCGLDGNIAHNAPLYGWTVEGDCVMEAKVSFQRTGDYDGAGLILYGDERHWAKCCLEATDFGKIAVVSVIAGGVSDDANGPNITADAVWLRIARKGSDCSIHYSLDGKYYEMYRICKVALPEKITAALIAQAPVGPAGYRCFEQIELKNISVENLRKGK